jgi:hypothetical protein
MVPRSWLEGGFPAPLAIRTGPQNLYPKHIVLVQVRDVVPNTDNTLVDSCGHPLPPCIVMERGESLDMCAARAKPDRPQAFTVRP